MYHQTIIVTVKNMSHHTIVRSGKNITFVLNVAPKTSKQVNTVFPAAQKLTVIIFKNKTKELTQSIQTNTQLYKENKKREKLILTLGNAYYESRKNTIDDPFSELINEIKEVDVLIQNMKNSQ